MQAGLVLGGRQWVWMMGVAMTEESERVVEVECGASADPRTKREAVSAERVISGSGDARNQRLQWRGRRVVRWRALRDGDGGGQGTSKC